jgi:putative Holliday junction resolvase
MGRVLGIDHGSVRLGISASDETNTIAFGNEVIGNDNKCMNRLKEIVISNNISEIVLGYPLNLKGGKTRQTLEVESFEEKLREMLLSIKTHEIKIVRWDERFTSKMAADSMLESGMKKKNRQKKSNLDLISATLLLQSYLDSAKYKS